MSGVATANAVMSSGSSSRLSQYSKLPPIGGTTEEPCQSLQDVEQAVDCAREDAKTLLEYLTEQTTLVQNRIEERLKVTLTKTTTFLSDQIQSNERSHSQEVMQYQAQVKEMIAAKEDLIKREKALVGQQTRLSIELAAAIQGRKQAEQKVETQRLEHEEQLKRQKSQREMEGALQKTAIEKELQTVQQLKDEVHRYSEEMRRLREKLKTEQSEKIRIENKKSDDEGKLSSANKKLTLEVSTLKAQLQSANNSLTTVHKQNDQLEKKMSQMEKDHTFATKTAAAHHSATVKSLEEKISQLQGEIIQMQIKYQEQIDNLLRQLHDAQSRVDNLSGFNEAIALEDARIRKLRLQNQEEKRLLEKERQCVPKKTVKLVT